MTIQPDGQFAINAGAKMTILTTAKNMPQNLSAMPAAIDWGESQSPVTVTDVGLTKSGKFVVPAEAGKRGSMVLTFNFESDDQGSFPPTATYMIELKEQSAGGTSSLNDPAPVTPPPLKTRGYDFITV
jgi:hypothetical protein